MYSKTDLFSLFSSNQCCKNMILRGVIKIFYWWDGDLKFYSGEGVENTSKKGLNNKEMEKNWEGITSRKETVI